ncbi:MAG: cation-translocating P-type ATPase [Vallitalea sp.]|jgi:heavy metal translocating P-type ATPase|nr:cation-translocating P-type ATPase [Vallitalea sp.]
MKKIMDFLFGIPMTIVSGIFLAVSLICMIANIHLQIDPAWVSVIISGVPMLILALQRLILEKWVSSALLISMAMVASIMIGEYFAAGEVAFIMALGAILEDKTLEKAHKGLKNLINLTPTKGRVISPDGKSEKIVDAKEIKIDDILRVLPGETIPVDGFIVRGNTSVDQSIMTGESLPIDKNANDKVYCGTLNCYGSIDVKANAVGENSSLEKMIKLVEEAENNKAPMQRIADKLAVWLVPIALMIAIVVWLATGDIVRGVTVLVVFCPCALALATPTSIMAAIGQATKHGIIIKSGAALESMGKVNTVAFDKTGTLTYGKLSVNEVYQFGKMNYEYFLSLVSSVENLSEHPLAKAIVEDAKAKEIPIRKIEEFVMSPGKGVSAKLDNKTILCGNINFMNENQININNEIRNKVLEMQRKGMALIIVAVNRSCEGVIGLSDIIRKNAKDVVTKLNNMDTQTVLLTGDNNNTAKYFASKVGITDIHSDLLPVDKVNHVKSLIHENKIVAMIGDGVNDAPALKTANVSIAMGTIGSDIAIEAADIALLGDDISKIPYLKRLAGATVKTIKLNITLSMIINAVAILLSVLGLLTPITGALVHNTGSVLVVLNAALLYDRKYDQDIVHLEK